MAAIRTLIVHRDPDLARIWARFLAREGIEADLAASAAEAYEALRLAAFDALVLDVEAPEALVVADFAAYRAPDMPVIPVSARTFFSQGGIFQIMPNARSVLTPPVDPADMAAVTGHYARRYRAQAGGTEVA